MVSNKLISEVLVNWGLQREIVSDIVFPETGEISDFFAGKDKYDDLYRINKAMTEWIGINMDKLSIS